MHVSLGYSPTKYNDKVSPNSVTYSGDVVIRVVAFDSIKLNAAQSGKVILLVTVNLHVLQSCWLASVTKRDVRERCSLWRSVIQCQYLIVRVTSSRAQETFPPFYASHAIKEKKQCPALFSFQVLRKWSCSRDPEWRLTFWPASARRQSNRFLGLRVPNYDFHVQK